MDDVPAALRFELRLTWMGGASILRKIKAAGYDVLTKRPRNSSIDWLRIVMQTLLFPHA
jgi:phytoene/squalene synthetase